MQPLKIFMHPDLRKWHWVTETETGLKGVSFILDIPGMLALSQIDPPYNDRYGDDTEYSATWLISIGDNQYQVFTNHEGKWQSTLVDGLPHSKYIETDTIQRIGKIQDDVAMAVTELVIPADHPLYNSFKLYELS